MTDFVKHSTEFENYKLRLLSLFKRDVDIADNPFQPNFKYFLAFEFDFIYNTFFFEGIKKFISKLGYGKLTFFTLEPSPEEYFFKRYGVYSVFEISVNATDEELSEIMMKNPISGTADAIALSSDDIAWYSESDDWAIIGSRDWEIGIAGFANNEIKDLFLDSFGEDADMFFSVQDQIKIYVEAFKFTEITRKEYNKFIESYKIR